MNPVSQQGQQHQIYQIIMLGNVLELPELVLSQQQPNWQPAQQWVPNPSPQGQGPHCGFHTAPPRTMPYSSLQQQPHGGFSADQLRAASTAPGPFPVHEQPQTSQPEETKVNELHHCNSCSAVFTTDELNAIEDFSQRVNWGSPCPSGQCRVCGGLCYADE
jgi:hypothetical protein